MKAMKVDVKAWQASFRRPLDLNYQRTFPLPPPTTMIGLAGAACGVSDFELWNDEAWEKLRMLKVAVFSKVPSGKAVDMMTVLKVKGNKIQERSPYFRELLFDAEYSLIYAGDEGAIDMLFEAFRNPVYALSLGREDELINVLDLKMIELREGEPVFYGTVIPGDIKSMEIELPDLNEFKMRKLEPPVVESVPIEFSVGEVSRTPTKKQVLTFLPYSLKVRIKNFEGVVYNVDGRNFTWMNS